MKNAIITFLKQPTTLVGIITALMFQLIFSVIWMTGYHGVSGNMSNLKIAIVNEDPDMGKKVAENLVKNFPFKTVQIDSLEAANQQLETRQIHMILQIPADFSTKLRAPGQQAALNYTVNEANPALVKSVMQGVAANITATVNKEAVTNGLQMALAQAKLPLQQVQPMAAGLSERVATKFNSIHPVSGFANQMVPLMMVLASYIGAMIMGLNMQQSAAALQNEIGKWQQFFARASINIAAAAVIALAGTSLVVALGGQLGKGFAAIWLFQTLFVLTFMFVAQIFLLLFGPAGMLFNILLLSVQLVTSGAMVPRELLSGFYQAISSYMPATYAVEGLMDVLFGGPGFAGSSQALVWILAVSAAAGTAVVAMKKTKQHEVAPLQVKVG